MKLTIFTIGHSTHPIEEFIKILHSFGIKQVVDVRTIPRSRHNPQFNEDALNKAFIRRLNSLYPHYRSGRVETHIKKLNQQSLEECIFPWICRLHADKRIH